MPILITRGRFTQEYVSRMIAAPEDREPAIKKLVESAGGKFLNLYFTTGDADFLLISEGEGEDAIAATMTAAAAGMISGMTTSRAWTGAEFKGIAEKAAKLAGAYKAPGQS